MREYTPLENCLACGSTQTTAYATFGNQPLANEFHTGSLGRDLFPLGLQVCLDCWNSQQLGVVDRERLYRDYAYASGTSASLRRYFRDFAIDASFFFAPKDKLSVLDIASNDGTLLMEFKARGHRVLGVEPSQLADNARAAGVPTINDFWSHESSLRALGTHPAGFDIVVAMNVLGHVSDPLEFLELCKAVLAPGGRIYVQTSQARMVENAEFDTVYHEHISFFTVSSFFALAKRAGLVVANIGHVPVHGTSYLVELVNYGEQQPADRFPLAIEEKLRGLNSESIYRNFYHHADMLIDHVQSTVALARREGFRIAGYGAAAKGMTFLNLAGIDLEFVADDAPLKINKLCPGNNIPVVASSHARLKDPRPIFWLILPWNMREEILQRILQLRPAHGDRFLTYFPRMLVTP